MNSKGESFIEALSSILIVTVSTIIVTSAIVFSLRLIDRNNNSRKESNENIDYVFNGLMGEINEYVEDILFIEKEEELLYEQKIKTYQSSERRFITFSQ